MGTAGNIPKARKCFERWTWWCYTQSPLLVLNHENEFFSDGVQQGALCHPVASRSNRRSSTSVPKVVDGGIVGSPELLLKVWEILKKGGVPLGLELNSKKCEWSWLNPDCNLVCPIDGVPITPTSEIQILGVPLGSQEFTESLSKGTF